MQQTQLTERDLALISIGRWPIDCDPPRPLNELEIAQCRHLGMMRDVDFRTVTAMVHRGTICYTRR